MQAPYKRVKHQDEHRALVESMIGRKLGRFEFVHHINGDKRDNRIENLELVTPAAHAVRHGQWKHPKVKVCEVCGHEYTPTATKRAQSKTCSKKCRYLLVSRLFRRPELPNSMYREDTYPSRKATRKE